MPPTKKAKRDLINTHEASGLLSQKGVSATTSSGSTMHALNDYNDVAFLEMTSISLTDWNFNSQFDSLTKEIAIDSTACEDNAKSVHEVTSNVENNAEIIHGSAQHCVTFENNAEQRINLNLDDTSACKCNFKILGEKLDMVNRKLTEMLARKSVLENAILKRGEFNGPAVEGGKLKLTKVNSNDREIKKFMETNNLPMTKIESFKNFEIKLGEEEFLSSVVCIYISYFHTYSDYNRFVYIFFNKFYLFIESNAYTSGRNEI